ncbi:hypothetical protein CYLTODRAFT_489128 [Cylindrobasidium torrendii FP15055 ss-10]|uniref:Uncharacterized protein n=1 Tax=Cylindrobasidium torrendii FP15055 ss-10 TaxID=1314674 RepID=A0A0D7BGK0_9AGAR|nr:hypothetical protein CYLTODRAFT_489128 [Cylindrobasidium torrendii FP15055 ss-10]
MFMQLFEQRRTRSFLFQILAVILLTCFLVQISGPFFERFGVGQNGPAIVYSESTCREPSIAELEAACPQLPAYHDAYPAPPSSPQLPPSAALSSPTTHTPIDRITLVVIWSVREDFAMPNFVQWFLRSVEANRKYLDLVIVAIKADGACIDLGPLGDNIRLVCLDHREYLEIHRDYFCHQWGCSAEQRKDTLAEITRRAPGDMIHSYYRIFRGPIFSRFFLSKTTYWGWADLDTIMGDFERAFPWDIARDFDVVVPTHLDSGSQVLMYLRGHMCFFKNSPETESKLLQYPVYHSFNDFMTEDVPSMEAEEAEFGTWIFYNSTVMDFLTFDALGDSQHKTARLYPEPVAFTTPEQPAYPLSFPSRPPTTPTWSDEPVSDLVVTLERGTYNGAGTLWFPQWNAVHFLSPVHNVDNRRYVYRKNGGEVRERLEAPAKFDMVGLRKGMQQWLYMHYLHIKKQDWFKSIPGDALDNGGILSFGGIDDYVEVWENGEVKYRGIKTRELP